MFEVIHQIVATEVYMFGHYEVLTRRQLYDCVWSVPVDTLAERFGLSGRGLGKLCERHQIPVPERGWWARKAAGQEVKQLPLVDLDNPYFDRIEIYVRDDFRKWLSTAELTDFESRFAAERDDAFLVVVPEGRSIRHRLITRTRQWLRDRTSVPHLDVRVEKKSEQRAMRIMTGIVLACEKRGYVFESGELPTKSVRVAGELIQFHIEEKRQQVDHVLTKPEAQEKAAGHGWWIPKFDVIPTERLQLVIDEDTEGQRKTFSDGEKQRVEDCLNDFMVALMKTAMVLRARKNYWREQERLHQEAERVHQEEERLRREEEAKKAAEKKRQHDLLHDAAKFRQAHSLMQMIAAVEEIAASETKDNAAMIEWMSYATGVAETLNPVARIAKQLLSDREVTR